MDLLQLLGRLRLLCCDPGLLPAELVTRIRRGDNVVDASAKLAIATQEVGGEAVAKMLVGDCAAKRRAPRLYLTASMYLDYGNHCVNKQASASRQNFTYNIFIISRLYLDFQRVIYP